VTAPTNLEHRAARSIRCGSCGAAPGDRCTGLSPTVEGHLARFYEFSALSKPELDDAGEARLTEVVGIRADARPFVHWLDGSCDFRLPSVSSGSSSSMAVYQDGKPGPLVRRELVDIAARHGLLARSSAGRRGTFSVTARGLGFYAAWRARVGALAVGT
jgi:hypothetical protein